MAPRPGRADWAIVEMLELMSNKKAEHIIIRTVVSFSLTTINSPSQELLKRFN